jgi:hypothetical protein
MRCKATRRMRRKELAFVRDITAVQITRDLTYREFSARLQKVEQFHVEQHRSTPHLLREIRRRIAELLLKEATARGLAFETCRRRMKQLEGLGFTDIESKAFHSLIYARVARQHGHRRVAQHTATSTADELRRSLRRKKSRLAKSCLDALENFLAQAK